jgi:hypothetical protein
MVRTVVLISCVKRKKSKPAKARELYDSTLFRAQKAYAEKFGNGWYILSAKHGLLNPETEIEPYEETLTTAGVSHRRHWAKEVFAEIEKCTKADDLIVITAGDAYCRFLVPLLEQRGNIVRRPVKGLSMGFIPGRLYALIAQSTLAI